MGRGRTTTGTIIACLWCFHRSKTDVRDLTALPKSTTILPPNFLPRGTVVPASTITLQSLLGSAEEKKALSDSASSEDKAAQEATAQQEKVKRLLHGWYAPVRSLVRVLADGRMIKRQVDRVIDHASSMQNLRQVVYQQQELAIGALERKKPFFVRRFD